VARSFVLGVGLLVSLAGGAGAQSSNEDVRKRHITCSAIFGFAATLTADKKLQDNLSNASLLLMLWASDVDTKQPVKARTDQAIPERTDQFVEIGRATKVGTPAAAKEFEAKYGGARKTCESWFAGEVKKRKPG